MTSRLTTPSATVKFGSAEPPLTVEEATRDERIRAAYTHFCAHQDEEAAEPETLLVVLRLLPPFGARRSWHVRELGQQLLTKDSNGKWTLTIK